LGALWGAGTAEVVLPQLAFSMSAPLPFMKAQSRRSRYNIHQGRTLPLAGAALIGALTLVMYVHSFGGGFLLDDDMYLTKNRSIQAGDGLYSFWCTTEPVDYYPVSNTSLWIEWRIWGMNPVGYRVTNLVLHLANTLLVWLILRRLAIPGAFLAALLWAIHPVNVESVAWIAQRKTVLSMLFALLSILCFLRSSPLTDPQEPQARSSTSRMAEGWRDVVGLGGSYWPSVLLFVLAMLSKASVATLPVILLAILWWQNCELSKRAIMVTAPFFAAAAALTVVDMWFLSHGAETVIRSANVGQRILGAAAAFWFYWLKAFLPQDQLFVYPQWSVQVSDWHWWIPLLAISLVTVFLVAYRRIPLVRGVLLAWIVFAAGLLPLVGLVDVGFMRYSLVADHYQYVALVAAMALLAAGCTLWYEKTSGVLRFCAVLVVTILVGTQLCFTWRQTVLFGDPARLYAATLEKNPDCWMIHHNLGVLFDDAGFSAEAVERFQEALRLKPGWSMALFNLGNSLSHLGRSNEAIDAYHKALENDPKNSSIHNNLGKVLLDLKRPAEAQKEFQLAVQLKPDFPEAHCSLGMTLLDGGQAANAVLQFQQAISLRRDYLKAWERLSEANRQMHNYAAAAEAGQQALTLARANGQTTLVEWLEAQLAKDQADAAGSPASSSSSSNASKREQ
jgi:Tfp pilus assembly protein PilF